MEIFTIGHSTRPIHEFIKLLKENDVNMLVDVRSTPYSNHNPQYNTETLAESLDEQNIQYIHMSELGGFRNPKKNSKNTAWTNKRFRGYADYMETKQFKNALLELIKITKDNTVAIMCSEAVPWRCHRSLIADALIVKDYQVIDIYGKNVIKLHKLTAFAHVFKDKLTYYPND